MTFRFVYAIEHVFSRGYTSRSPKKACANTVITLIISKNRDANGHEGSAVVVSKDYTGLPRRVSY